MMIVENKFVQFLHRIDCAAFMKLVHLNTRKNLCLAARYVSKTADGWLYPLIPLFIAFNSHILAIQFAVLLVLAYGCERILYFILKKGIKRNRPPRVIANFESVISASDEFSFPSGHTSAAFLAVSLLVLFFPKVGFEMLYLWATSVALSRIILGVHFPLDTIMGAVLGFGVAFISFQIMINCL